MGTFAVSIAALALSAVNTVGGLVIAYWVAHRDRAHLIIQPSGGYITPSPLSVLSPQPGSYDVKGKRLFTLHVANRGRRPITISGGGLKYRTTGVWRLVFWYWRRSPDTKGGLMTSQHRLPNQLNEQESMILLGEMKELIEAIAGNLKSAHQLGPAYATDVTGKEYVARMPRSLWRELARGMKARKDVDG